MSGFRFWQLDNGTCRRPIMWLATSLLATFMLGSSVGIPAAIQAQDDSVGSAGLEAVAAELPGETVLYWEYTGRLRTEEALQQTAAYAAFDESGLMPAIKTLVSSIPWDAMIKADLPDDADVPYAELFDGLWYVRDHGAVVSLTLPTGPAFETIPYAVVVIPDAAEHLPTFNDWVRRANEAQLQQLPSLNVPLAPPLPVPIQPNFQPIRPTVPPPSNGAQNPQEVPDPATPVTPRIQVQLQPQEAPSATKNDESPPRQPARIEERQIGSRKVFEVIAADADGEPKPKVAWWTSDKHLVFYIGMTPVETRLAEWDAESYVTLDGVPNWQASRANPSAGDVQTSRVWVNFGRLLTQFGDIPIPLATTPATVRSLLSPLGLDTLQTGDLRSACNGRLLTSTWTIQSDAAADPVGWQALLNQPQLSLGDIPPLPADVQWFNLYSLDLRATIAMLKDIIDRYAQLAGPEAQMQWQMARQIMATQDISDFERILDCLGPTICVYNDAEQEVLGWGPSAVAIEIEDPERLLSIIERWKEAKNSTPLGDFEVRTRTLAGREIFGIVADQGVMTPSFAVCNGWLVAGIQPQTVQAFVLRAEGKLPRWTVEQLHEVTRQALPEEFIGFSYSDPKSSVRFLVSLVPWAVDFVRFGIKSQSDSLPEWDPQVSALDIPPAELVTSRLFPNVTVSTYADGRYESRTLASTRVDSVSTLLLGYYLGLAGLVNLE